MYLGKTNLKIFKRRRFISFLISVILYEVPML